MRACGAEFFGSFWLVLGGFGSAVLAAAFPEVGIGLLGVSPSAATEPALEPIAFATDDGGRIHADLYGAAGGGDRGVVLAHGGRFDRGSWEPQARALAAAGFRVLAFDFRGYGESRGPGDKDPLSAPLHLDVLAAVREMRSRGASRVAVLGASMGGTAASRAAIESASPGFDRLVLLACPVGGDPSKLGGRKLFLIARDDPAASGAPRLVGIRMQFEQVPEPKRLVVLEGSAHAQFLFQSAEGPRAMEEILGFLSAP